MTVAEKLNLLMDLTGTKNRRLAQALCVDPSVICHFRSGKRSIPENSNYISEIAEFFFQRYYESDCTGLLDQVMINYFDPVVDFRTMLEQWLSEADSVPITELLKGEIAPKKPRATPFRSFSGSDAWAAAIAAFSAHLANAEHGRLKLLQQTALPTAQARAAMNQQLTAAILPFLQRGGSATRVMPQLSTLTAETENARHWMPLLLTGNLQLFEYDGLQENALQTDLIVLSGVAALQSLRAAGETKVTVQMTTDPFTVSALETTLDTYLVACRPLSRINSFQDAHNSIVPDRQPTPMPLVYVYSSLPFSTVPAAMLRDGRQDLEPYADLAFFCERQHRQLIAMAERQSITELFPLLTAEEVLAGRATLASALPEEAQPLRYTLQTYAWQLSTILRLLYTTPNYHVCLIPAEAAQCNLCFFAQSQMTLFPLKNVRGLQLMTVSHSGTVQVMRQQYQTLVQQMQADPAHRSRTIETLRQRLEEMKRAIRDAAINGKENSE